MRALIQRVNYASVEVNGSLVAEIDKGLMILIGITDSDDHEDVTYLAEKITNMRIFPSSDLSSGFDRSVIDICGSVLLVSQFTLYASTRKGRRPSFTDAAKPEISGPAFHEVVNAFESHGITVRAGIFGADMRIKLENFGPVTIYLDSYDRKIPRS